MNQTMTCNSWFIIRADSNENIGIGHITRCLALAEWAADFGLKPILLTKSTNDFINFKINKLEGQIIALPESTAPSSNDYTHSSWLQGNELEDASHCSHAIEKLSTDSAINPRFIMVDHYALGSPWETRLKSYAPILAIDDLCDRQHDCRWLIDQTYGRFPSDYKPRVPTDCELFVGSMFALLRKEFAQIGAVQRRSPGNPVRILISLGGVDKMNFTSSVAQMILNSQLANRVSLTIVSSALNPNLEQLKLLAEKAQQISLMVNAENMAELMINHDICIGAAGSTSWERCTMGLPTLMLVLAENQQLIAKNLHKNGIAVNLDDASMLSPQNLISNINELIENRALFRQLVEKSRNACDGLGCNRIINEVLRETC